MADSPTSDELIRRLAGEFRVLTLGGIAIISHGFSRNTFDADIWVDPMDSAEKWAARIAPFVYFGDTIQPESIGTWEPVRRGDLEETVTHDGVIRIRGLERPVDIFRDPNELEIADFDEVWERAAPLRDGTRLPDAIDLLVSKSDTGRDKDLLDIAFLENKAEKEYLEKLTEATEEDATRMLARFLTPRVAEAALHHPAAAVVKLALRYLREMAEEGNPFAGDILKQRE